MENSTRSYPRSVGEELFLVHLNRSESSGHDNDSGDGDRHHHHHAPELVNPIAIATLRKREHTVGEELWLVHCKRSRGMTFDGDNEEGFAHVGSDHSDHDETEAAIKNNRSTGKRNGIRTTTTPTKTRGASTRSEHECHYNLRSKDSTNMKRN
jgi:hypothetical protein